MTVLVVGATGATGRLLVRELLERDVPVRAIVRDAARVEESLRASAGLSVVEGSVSKMSDAEIRDAVAGCSAAASCLGHNVSFAGLFGPPYRLVADATRRICSALEAEGGDVPRRFVLMNTSGVRNPDLNEQVSARHRAVVLALRVLLPPHADNEAAAEHLRRRVGSSHPGLEWVAVRPDGLVDHDEVSDYDVHPSPIPRPDLRCRDDEPDQRRALHGLASDGARAVGPLEGLDTRDLQRLNHRQFARRACVAIPVHTRSCTSSTKSWRWGKGI